MAEVKRAEMHGARRRGYRSPKAKIALKSRLRKIALKLPLKRKNFHII